MERECLWQLPRGKRESRGYHPQGSCLLPLVKTLNTFCQNWDKLRCKPFQAWLMWMHTTSWGRGTSKLLQEVWKHYKINWKTNTRISVDLTVGFPKPRQSVMKAHALKFLFKKVDLPTFYKNWQLSMVPHTCHPWFKVILGYILNSSSAGSPAWYFASEIETPNKQKPTEQVIGYLKDFFYYIYLFYVRVHGGQVTVWGNLFFPSTTWVPRIKLRLGSKCLT